MVSWAFFSDFHVSERLAGQQDPALSALLEAATNEGLDEVDVVVLGGDIAFSGRAAEYELFASQFLLPLRQVVGARPILAVPGNHDVNCDDADPVFWEKLGSRQGQFFEESPAGIAVRKNRARAFESYERFLDDHNLIGPRPSREVSKLFSLEGTTFLLTNTAFLSDKDPALRTDDSLPAPTGSLRSFRAGTLGPRRIVVGHHPPESFVQEQREKFKSFLTGARAVYIHGHTHRPSASHGPSQVVTIGIPASYQAGLDASATTYYRNGFAKIHVAEDLTLELFGWNLEYGRWTPETSVPADFEQCDDRPGVYRFSMGRREPMSPVTSEPSQSVQRRSSPQFEAVSLLGGAGEEQLLSLCKDLTLVPRHFRPDKARLLRNEPGYRVFQFASGTGQSRLRVAVANGSLHTREDVENINTELDYESLEHFYFITLGALSPEARASYNRLRQKPLTIIENRDLAVQLATRLSKRLVQHVGTLDSALVHAELLLTPDDLFLLVESVGSNPCFCVFGCSGDAERQSAPVVTALIDQRPRLRSVTYSAPEAGSVAEGLPTTSFDERSYLERVERNFRTVQYAGLASFGFRLNAITLEELYVTANAVDGGVEQAVVARVLDEALQGLQVPEELRAQLEARIRETYSSGRVGQTAGATKLYQRHGSLLVLGDPGSGKTCFVKREILSYVKREQDADTWYARHLPVYVPLSELATHPSVEDDLFVAMSAVVQAQGLELTTETLIERSNQGGIAYFLDGLDEISSVEQRARIFRQIADLVTGALRVGNRVVVTSRPAAIRMLSIPDGLHSVSLRGLSENDMRLLAKRVLTAKAIEGGIAISLNEGPLAEKDETTIEEVLHDCRNVPGLRRLAQNPLLFTLLIMLYANGGRPAARRHRVYQQAVQTLAAVRSRQANNQAFSESDLRRRLGSVAIGAFAERTVSIPSWTKAVRTVAAILAEEKREALGPGHRREAEEYLQRVGDATGLIVPQRRGSAQGGDTLTFMHHSFLEYYAAAGLLFTENPDQRASELSRIPRWREVILLYAGIVADQQDVGVFVSRMLNSTGSTEGITLEGLDFAMECALECDVPSEHTLTILLRRIADAGIVSLRRDSQLRSRFGGHLRRLYLATHSQQILEFFEDGLGSKDSVTCAAYVELLGAVLQEEDVVPGRLGLVFADVAKRTETPVLVALCRAISVAPVLRDSNTSDILTRCFRGSRATKFAAVRACEVGSELALDCWNYLIKCLDEPAYIATVAASALLHSGMKLDATPGIQRVEVVGVIRCLLAFGREEQLGRQGNAVDWTFVENLFESEDESDVEFATMLLPWVRGNDLSVYERVMSTIRGHRPQRQVWALEVLRFSKGAASLLKVSDLDSLFDLLHADTRDVRMTAAKVIGHLRPGPEGVRVLTDYVRIFESRPAEFRVGLRALVAADSATGIHTLIEERLRSQLRLELRQTDNAKRELLELLQLALQSDNFASRPLVGRLRSCVENMRWSGEVRGAALVALGWLWEPSEESVNYFIEFARREKPELHSACAEAVWRFTRRCGRNVEHVVAIADKLDALKESSAALVARSRGGSQARVDVSRLREALTEMSLMQSAHAEYDSLTH